MYELVALSVGIGVGVMGIAAYVKTNLESRHDLRILGEKLEKKEEEVARILKYGTEIDSRLLITKEKDLIDGAHKDLWILGINALGVFHESFENIIGFMGKDGRLRVLLLDPDCEIFKRREQREEGGSGEKSGRLGAEYLTTIAFCKDVINFSDSEGSLELRVYSEDIGEALLCADPREETGIVHILDYGDGIRGYSGRHRYITCKVHRDAISLRVKRYEEIWSKGKTVILWSRIARGKG
ncbi:MAG: hypothetical protein O7B35_19015 [Deltaproteobacteria bacterium]|nr:hypothetical protein [Deltaproteobacteria bacterium]